MGKVIRLHPKSVGPPETLITSKPWEFRRADWKTAFFIQMQRSQVAQLEDHREKVYRNGEDTIGHLPPHFLLRGGVDSTMRAMYFYRKDEEKMRDVYYLIGLMDCMINQVNPILRTDLIRSLYKKVFALKNELNIQWYGPLDQVLLPIDSSYFNEDEYRSQLKRAGTMNALYHYIRKGTDEMFDILSLEYVFYCPSAGEQP